MVVSPKYLYTYNSKRNLESILNTLVRRAHLYRDNDIHLEIEVLFERKLAAFSDHELHTHDALEISVLMSNNALYRLSHQDFIGDPGDVFIFKPFDPHWTLVTEKHKPAKWVMILFSPAVVRSFPDGFKMLAPFYAVDIFQPLISGKLPYAQQIHQATKLALEEGDLRLPGWQSKQYILLMDILIQLYRCYLDAIKDFPDKGQLETGIITSIEYLLSSFHEEIDTDKLIGVSGLKKTLFYQKFQEITRLSPNEFINRLRLQQTAHLLKSSSRSITEIAFESGFNSLSYFNKIFKKTNECSPSEYRAFYL